MKDNFHLINGLGKGPSEKSSKRDFMEDIESEVTFKGRLGFESKGRKEGNRCFETRR